MFSLFRPSHDPEGPPPPPDRSLSTRLAWLLLVGGAAVIALRATLATVIEIHGDGMAPTLLDGDHVVLVRGAWGLERGDLVVYDPTPPAPAHPAAPDAAPDGDTDRRARPHDPRRPSHEPLRNTAVLDPADLGLDDEWAKVQRRSGVTRAEPAPAKSFRIGRILALPGDTITLHRGGGAAALEINGVPLEHKAAGLIELVVRGRPDPSEDRREPLRPRPRGSAFESIGSRRYQVLSTPGAAQAWPGLALPAEPGPVEIHADGYLILADNRDDGACCDSRALGFLDGARIRGEIVLRLGGSAHVPEDIDPRSRGLLWRP